MIYLQISGKSSNFVREINNRQEFLGDENTGKYD